MAWLLASVEKFFPSNSPDNQWPIPGKKLGVEAHEKKKLRPQESKNCKCDENLSPKLEKKILKNRKKVKKIVHSRRTEWKKLITIRTI